MSEKIIGEIVAGSHYERTITVQFPDGIPPWSPSIGAKVQLILVDDNPAETPKGCGGTPGKPKHVKTLKYPEGPEWARYVYPVCAGCPDCRTTEWVNELGGGR